MRQRQPRFEFECFACHLFGLDRVVASKQHTPHKQIRCGRVSWELVLLSKDAARVVITMDVEVADRQNIGSIGVVARNGTVRAFKKRNCRCRLSHPIKSHATHLRSLQIFGILLDCLLEGRIRGRKFIALVVNHPAHTLRSRWFRLLASQCIKPRLSFTQLTTRDQSLYLISWTRATLD